MQEKHWALSRNYSMASNSISLWAKW